MAGYLEIADHGLMWRFTLVGDSPYAFAEHFMMVSKFIECQPESRLFECGPYIFRLLRIQDHVYFAEFVGEVDDDEHLDRSP